MRIAPRILIRAAGYYPLLYVKKNYYFLFIVFGPAHAVLQFAEHFVEAELVGVRVAGIVGVLKLFLYEAFEQQLVLAGIKILRQHALLFGSTLVGQVTAEQVLYFLTFIQDL